MKKRELKPSTIEMANTTNMSGRATANGMNREKRTGKGRGRERIPCSTVLGSLILAGLFVPLAPLPGRAAAGGLPSEIESLRSTVSALQGQVSALQNDNTTLQNEITNLRTSNTTLQNQINSLQTASSTLQSQLAAVQSNHALALGPFVSVDPNPEIGVAGPNIIFSGANIHIISGLGSTNDNGNPSGLGNLIIGYDEDPALVNFPLATGDRGGSHNLVIGRWNRFTQSAFGGLVAGELNTIRSEATSVSGGLSNIASGFDASVSGGQSNIANGGQSSISGGQSNIASGGQSSVSAGLSNTASGGQSSVSGGQSNTASGGQSSVSAGLGNTAGGGQSSVSGGQTNTASGGQSGVSGGVANTAGGIATVVIGGQNVTDNKDVAIAPIVAP
jgi:FtsZ-binding cell division protein ZapB